jgi:hypothetical protein
MVMKLKVTKADALSFTRRDTETLSILFELHNGKRSCCDRHLLEWCMRYFVRQAIWEIEEATEDAAEEAQFAGAGEPLAGSIKEGASGG